MVLMDERARMAGDVADGCRGHAIAVAQAATHVG
jgi:hypothetical protein